MIKVRDLQLPSAQASESISFQLQSGEILGVIGKNTSGKSELLKSIAMPHFARYGHISINHVEANEDSHKYRHLVGYLPNPVQIEPHLTGIEFLELVSGSYQITVKDRTEKILEYAKELGCHSELFSLIERAPNSTRQKFAFIAAILHQPRVLLLDEPWQYLDWSAKENMTKIIRSLEEKGTTILIASNELDLLELVTKQYLVLDEGKLLASGSITELSNTVRAKSKSLPDIWQAMEKLGQLRD